MARKKVEIKPDSFQKITTYFGYGLFTALIIGVVLSTVIPFGGLLLFSPGVRHVNVAISLVSLAAGAILPILLGYILGDKITHSKTRRLHHFNGVLFGVAAYWISLFFGLVNADVLSSIREAFPEPLATIVGGWPIFATLAVMALVAWPYSHNPGKKSILEQTYYRVVLFAGIAAMHILILVNQFMYYQDVSAYVISAVYLVAITVLITASYRLLARHLPVASTRLTAAAIAASIAYITAAYTSQLLYAVPYTSLTSILPLIAGILAWAGFLYLVRRKKVNK